MRASADKPLVLVDMALPSFLAELFEPHCRLGSWSIFEGESPARAEVSGIITYAHPLIGADELERFPNLRVVSNYGVGVDHIDLAAARDRAIVVGNTPGVVDGATADFTLALILGVARNLVPGDHYARSEEFRVYDPANLLGRDVFGACLGIVGMGRIGQQVARRARAFEMDIVYHNRHPLGREAEELAARYVSLEELLGQADFVSLNMPLTPATRGLIGAAELRRMKPSAYLINTARGGVLDHDALYRALTERWIAGAAIDVTEPEPLPRDHGLLGLENLLITPHLGTSTIETRARMGEMTQQNLVAGLNGTALPYPAT